MAILQMEFFAKDAVDTPRQVVEVGVGGIDGGAALDEPQQQASGGIVVGDTIVDAVKALYDYYGDELIDILGCKAIIDNVFEFETARDDGFDYEIVYAPKNQ